MSNGEHTFWVAFRSYAVLNRRSYDRVVHCADEEQAHKAALSLAETAEGAAYVAKVTAKYARRPNIECTALKDGGDL